MVSLNIFGYTEYSLKLSAILVCQHLYGFLAVPAISDSFSILQNPWVETGEIWWGWVGSSGLGCLLSVHVMKALCQGFCHFFEVGLCGSSFSPVALCLAEIEPFYWPILECGIPLASSRDLPQLFVTCTFRTASSEKLGLVWGRG